MLWLLIFAARRVYLPDAPLFPNDATSESYANWRFVNYPVWRSMAEECDLEEWFDHVKLDGKSSDEIVLLTEQDYQTVNEVYLIRTAFAEGKPGWDYKPDEGEESAIGVLPSVTKNDEYLARLAWLRFWLRWVLDNCEQPSVVVSW